MQDIKLQVRMDGPLHQRLVAVAAENKRSLNSEVLARLQASFEIGADTKALQSELELAKARIEHHRFIAQQFDATRVLLASVYLTLAERVGKTMPEAIVKAPMLAVLAEWLSTPSSANEVRTLLTLVETATPEVLRAVRQLAAKIDAEGVDVKEVFFNSRTGEIVAPPTKPATGADIEIPEFPSPAAGGGLDIRELNDGTGEVTVKPGRPVREQVAEQVSRDLNPPPAKPAAKRRKS